MPSPSKIRKGLGVLARPYFLRAFLRYRVAAATEHLSALRLAKAATLIDAGANKGQFTLAFRALNKDGAVIAFEPLPQAADVFAQLFDHDSLITLERAALSKEAGTASFYVADRADSSSLLAPGVGQARAFGVRAESTVDVSVKRLDDCIDLSHLAHPVFLKVDVQGGELALFEGCANLEKIDFIYAELSYVELYERQPLFHELVEYLADRGFSVAGVFNQVVTLEFGPTQADVLFRRAAE